MTAAQPSTAWAELQQQLPDDIAARLNYTSRIDYFLNIAIDQQHWTVPQLATEATRNLDTAENVGAVITARFETASTVPPPKPKAQKPGTRPFCDTVINGLTCAERAGQIEDPRTGLPTGRCPCRTPATEVNA